MRICEKKNLRKNNANLWYLSIRIRMLVNAHKNVRVVDLNKFNVNFLRADRNTTFRAFEILISHMLSEVELATDSLGHNECCRR